MCSHYTTLKKRDQMEKYFRARGIPLPESVYQDWLEVSPQQARELLVPFPADELVAEPVGSYPSRKKKSAPEGAS